MGKLPVRLLCASRKKRIAVALGCLLGALVGVCLLMLDQPPGWGVTLVLGLGALFFTVFACRCPFRLELRPESLVIVEPFQSVTIPWEEIGAVTARHSCSGPMLLFSLAGNSGNTGARRRQPAQCLYRHDFALNASYGLAPEELARLMNEYRNAGAYPLEPGK